LCIYRVFVFVGGIWLFLRADLAFFAYDGKDGQHIAVIGPNKIVKLTVTMTRWPCCSTIQRTTAL